jgi:hypothetical protein
MARTRRRSTARRAKSKARGKAQRSTALQVAARLGMGTRGVLHIVVGILALQLGLGGDGDEQADKEGAFERIADVPLGRLMLAVLAAGFLGYAAWRLVQAVLDPQHREDDDPWWKRYGRRVGYGFRSLVYLWFFLTVLPFVLGRDQASGGQEQQVTARVLDWPLGRYAVGAAALGLMVAGGSNLYRAVSRRYCKDLDPDADAWAAPFALSGLLTRAAIFGAVGWWFLQAARQSDADEAVGLDQALKRISGGTPGTVALLVLGAGVIAFGVFCLLQARYRDVA